MEKTIVGITESGFEPMFLTYGFGHPFGEVVVPHFYGDRQKEIAKRENFQNFYLDPKLAKILEPVIFKGNLEEYFKNNLERREDVEKDLRTYLRSFEAESLDGKIKRFESPDMVISAGSIVSYKPEIGYYTYPAAQSDLIRYLPEMYEEVDAELPFEMEDIDELAVAARESEESYRMAFIPEINSFSYYRTMPKLKNEVSTPPLKKRIKNNMYIPPSIYVNISAEGVRAKDIIEAAKKIDLNVFSPEEQKNVLGNKGPPSLIYNDNVKAVLARAGWGTLWMCQIAEKPIITPAYKLGDHPEPFHNNKTIQALDIGVVYEDFNEDIINQAVGKTENIKKINHKIIEKFGSLEGLAFVEEVIRKDLA